MELEALGLNEMDEQRLQLAIEEKTSFLRKWRNGFKVPETLQTIAMYRIAKSWKFFLRQRENPFRHLPNSIVQRFLRLIVDARKRRIRPLFGKKSDCEEAMVQLLLNLLNANVTEFACDDFGDAHGIYLGHLLDNCPKICRISRARPCYVKLPLKKMISRWENLQFISFKKFECTDESAELMAQCMPQIRGLECMIHPEKFTLTSREHFIKMKNLSYLSVASHRCFKGDFQSLMARIVCAIPNLRSLELEDGANCNNKFVKLFGELYPSKILIMKKICLNKHLKGKWPSCLLAECLSLSSISSSAIAEDICSLSFPLKSLSVSNVPASIIYQLVEQFGHKITDLKIIFMKGARDLSGEALNLCRVLVHCPEVETIYFKADENCAEIGNLSPQNFKHCKKLETHLEGESEDPSLEEQLFKMFLIGSENYERTLVLQEYQIKSALEALMDNPNSLNQLERVDFSIFLSDQLLHVAWVLALLLITRSPYLKSLGFYHFRYSRKEYLQVIYRDHKWLIQIAEMIGLEINSNSDDDSSEKESSDSSDCETSRDSSTD